METEHRWFDRPSEFLTPSELRNFTVTFLDDGVDTESSMEEKVVECTEFKVEVKDHPEKHIWRITSKQLMKILVSHFPLNGKTFNIRMTGTGYGTSYAVNRIEEE